MTVEAYKAALFLKEDGISAEVIDLRSVKPLDKETLLESVKKTGRVVIADPDWKTCGFSAELSAVLTEEAFGALKAPPKRVTYPDSLSPTSWAIANHYYPTAKDIALTALELLNRPTQARKLLEALIQEKLTVPLDVPDQSFTGPF
jgi:pyruvate dehydrogenase E1 component beta subunit